MRPCEEEMVAINRHCNGRTFVHSIDDVSITLSSLSPCLVLIMTSFSHVLLMPLSSAGCPSPSMWSMGKRIHVVTTFRCSLTAIHHFHPVQTAMTTTCGPYKVYRGSLMEALRHFVPVALIVIEYVKYGFRFVVINLRYVQVN